MNTKFYQSWTTKHIEHTKLDIQINVSVLIFFFFSLKKVEAQKHTDSHLLDGSLVHECVKER